MFDFKPDDVDLYDIVFALCNQSRWCGHNPTLTVGAHSVYVHNELKSRCRDPLVLIHGLLHDAHEAYTGDITRPVKQFIEETTGLDVISDLQDTVDKAIFKALGVPELDEQGKQLVKMADDYVMASEASLGWTEDSLPGWVEPILKGRSPMSLYSMSVEFEMKRFMNLFNGLIKLI